MFKALVLTREPSLSCTVRDTDFSERPYPAHDGEVEFAVEYSTLNYKDALAIVNGPPIVRRWPMVPGIDGSGTVLHSGHASFKPGDSVILNGWGVGEGTWGCLGQRARVNGDWLIKRPVGMDSRTAMTVGTAGYTAMLCVTSLESHGVRPSDGDVLVTGATGGVGSFATALLSQLGYRVVASTGKPSESGYLSSLGAAELLDRKALELAGKPLQKERFAAVIDCVGSHTLANALAQTRYGGVVAACGLAQGMDLPASVAPFILRGVTLVGIDSVMAPLARRSAAWDRLAQMLSGVQLDRIRQDIGLSEVASSARAILQNQHRGRIVVDVNRS